MNSNNKELDFRKSSFSQYTWNVCVEVAQAEDGSVCVRDSKNPDGPMLQFTQKEWGAFIAGVKNQGFDIS